MWSKRLNAEVTDPSKLCDFDLNMLVAEMEGYIFDDEGEPFERGQYLSPDGLPDKIYLSADYDRLFRLMTNHKISVTFFPMREDKHVVFASSVVCNEGKHGVTIVCDTVPRAILECYVLKKLKNEELKVGKI